MGSITQGEDVDRERFRHLFLSTDLESRLAAARAARALVMEAKARAAADPGPTMRGEPAAGPLDPARAMAETLVGRPRPSRHAASERAAKGTLVPRRTPPAGAGDGPARGTLLLRAPEAVAVRPAAAVVARAEAVAPPAAAATRPVRGTRWVPVAAAFVLALGLGVVLGRSGLETDLAVTAEAPAPPVAAPSGPERAPGVTAGAWQPGPLHAQAVSLSAARPPMPATRFGIKGTDARVPPAMRAPGGRGDADVRAGPAPLAPTSVPAVAALSGDPLPRMATVDPGLPRPTSGSGVPAASRQASARPVPPLPDASAAPTEIVPGSVIALSSAPPASALIAQGARRPMAPLASDTRPAPAGAGPDMPRVPDAPPGAGCAGCGDLAARASTPAVTILTPQGATGADAGLRVTLARLGFADIDARPAAVSVAASQVRFVRTADRDAARALATALGARLVDLTWTVASPGEGTGPVEVWLAPSDPPVPNGDPEPGPKG